MPITPDESDGTPRPCAHCGAPVDGIIAQRDAARDALKEIKARCDSIAAGEFGGLNAALDMSNIARRALRAAGERERPSRSDVRCVLDGVPIAPDYIKRTGGGDS